MAMKRLPILRAFQEWRQQLKQQQLSCVRQFDHEDCGAACLATVAKQHGRRISLGQARELVGTTASGTTLLGIKRGAEQLGFHARAARADGTLLNELQNLPKPLICHWRGNHWVVLHDGDDSSVQVADPALGLRTLSKAEFLSGWQNGILQNTTISILAHRCCGI